MQFYPHRTVEEQAERLPYELREAYRNSQIDRITIFDGEEELVVTGYAEYSYLEEKSYKTQPIRSQNGTIQEIEEYATFLTPRLIIKYNMMGIEDYRSLMKMLKKRNGFWVRCCDVVEDTIVKKHMYVAPPSMPIIYQQYLVALGIKEYNIEMIGTNNETIEEEISFFISSSIGNSITYTIGFGNSWRDVVNKYGEDYSFEISENDQIVSYGKIVYFLDEKNNYVPVLADDYVFKNRTYVK